MNNEHEMMTKTSLVSLVCANSGKLDDNGKELVITCGYSKAGKYGYFICKQKEDGKGRHLYSDQLEFFQKHDERTFTSALARFKEIVGEE